MELSDPRSECGACHHRRCRQTCRSVRGIDVPSSQRTGRERRDGPEGSRRRRGTGLHGRRHGTIAQARQNPAARIRGGRHRQPGLRRDHACDRTGGRGIRLPSRHLQHRRRRSDARPRPQPRPRLRRRDGALAAADDGRARGRDLGGAGAGRRPRPHARHRGRRHGEGRLLPRHGTCRRPSRRRRAPTPRVHQRPRRHHTGALPSRRVPSSRRGVPERIRRRDHRRRLHDRRGLPRGGRAARRPRRARSTPWSRRTT